MLRDGKKKCWAILCLLVLVACSGSADAQRAVAEFRARAAQKLYGEIYGSAAQEFRDATSEEQFMQFMAGLDRKLGSWQSAPDPQWLDRRGPAGHIVTLTYDSTFERGPAVEQFTWRIEDSEAVLLGYNVNSALFVTQ